MYNSLQSAPDGDMYETAQICLNGHIINSSYLTSPEHNEDFCTKCGKPTVIACKQCSSKIRGHLMGSIVLGCILPSFCYKCGAAYPWTEEAVKAAKELVSEQDELTSHEKDILTQSVEEMTKEGPRTPLAAERYRKFAGKLGKFAAESLRKIVVDVASETAKKILWPDTK